jgi:hypothetical protein
MLLVVDRPISGRSDRHIPLTERVRSVTGEIRLYVPGAGVSILDFFSSFQLIFPRV